MFFGITIVGVISPLIFLFFRDSPESLGIRKDGADVASNTLLNNEEGAEDSVDVELNEFETTNELDEEEVSEDVPVTFLLFFETGTITFSSPKV